MDAAVSQPVLYQDVALIMRILLRYRAAIAALLLCGCVISCDDDVTAPEITDEMLLQDTALRFAMDRWLMDWHAFVTFAERDTAIPGSPRDASGPFNDIDPLLYHRLLNVDLPVRPIGECNTFETTHPDFENSGFCVWYSHITFTSSATAVVYVGYWCNMMSSAGALLLLERGTNGWEVIHSRGLWIS